MYEQPLYLIVYCGIIHMEALEIWIHVVLNSKEQYGNDHQPSKFSVCITQVVLNVSVVRLAANQHVLYQN